MLLDRKFKAIKIGLMRSQEFGLLRGVAMHGKTYLTTDIPTACTNGRDCWFNPDFLFKEIRNNPKGTAFIMAHEWMHKAAMHLFIYQALAEVDTQRANMATDFWINDRLILADPNKRLIEMPENKHGEVIGLHDLKYRDWIVKRIFHDLKQEPEDGEDGGDGEEGEEGDGPSTEGNGPARKEGRRKNDSLDEHDWEGAKKLSKEESKKVKEDVKQAIRQGIHANSKAGTGGLKDALGLEELVTPKVDWRAALRTFMNSTCRKKERSTWRRPNRRFLHQDIIMPTLEGNSINEAVLARDTSGSMFCKERLGKVSSEMVGIVETLHIEKIHVIDWDGKAEHRGVFSSDTLKSAPVIKNIIGGGGTDPVCVSDYLVEHNIKPDCVVMLTDGEVNSWGNWAVPVLWAIADNDNIVAPLGKTVHIN